MGLIEQAAKRLEELKRAGIDVPVADEGRESSAVARSAPQAPSVPERAVRTLGDAQKPMSKGAARRLVEQGGAYVNRVKVTSFDHKVTLDHLATESMLVVSGGKKDHRIVRVI